MISPPILLVALLVGQAPAPPPDADAADLTRPRLLALDYRDAPMGAVIRDLTARSGCRVTIYEKMTDWLETRITLQKPTPLPFWSALDEVCRSGRFLMNLGVDQAGHCVALFRNERPRPFSDHGPFRVVLNKLTVGDRGGLELLVWVEPRMLIRRAGNLRDLAALDDQGRSLTLAGYSIGEGPEEFGGYTLQLAAIQPTDRPVRAVKTLRGTAPVVVARLAPEPVAVPLADAVGRSIRGPHTTLTVRSITRRPIEDQIVVILPGEGGARPRPEMGMVVAATIRRTGPRKPGEVRPPLEYDSGQLECVDAAGKVWTATSSFVSGEAPRAEEDAIAVDVRFADEDLQPMPWSGKLDGLTLRHRELTAVPVAVPFEFRDIPLP